MRQPTKTGYRIRANISIERGEVRHPVQPLHKELFMVVSCEEMRAEFSLSAAAVKLTILQWKTTDMKISGQHKLVLVLDSFMSD